MHHYARGQRVTLVRMHDPYTSLTPGLRGSVLLVDSAGTVHVRWDNGSSLGVVFDAGDQILPLTAQEMAEEATDTSATAEGQ